ncbi:MAG: hypothetical protein P8J79_06310 [Halioglobus sp.]|nr:hypothetical protein [Halioglobus sp.]
MRKRNGSDGAIAAVMETSSRMRNRQVDGRQLVYQLYDIMRARGHAESANTPYRVA